MLVPEDQAEESQDAGKTRRRQARWEKRLGGKGTQKKSLHRPGRTAKAM